MRRQDKNPNTPTFTYLNANPHNRFTTDCVVRAIATAMCANQLETDINWQKLVKDMWYVVLESLNEITEQTGFMYDEPDGYSKYLTKVGFKKMPQPRYANGTKMTLAEFVAKHPKGTYLVHLPHHLTVVVNGKHYDTWNWTRSSRRVGNYWEKLDEKQV